MVQAAAPARLIEGGISTEATVAQVLVSKYADHLPLHRQAQIYKRQGVDRSTLADWVGRAAWHLRILEHLKASSKLFADEMTGPGARSGPGKDEDWPVLGLCARHGREPTRPVSSMSMRRSQERSSDGRRRQQRVSGILLEPCATALLRTGGRRSCGCSIWPRPSPCSFF